MENFDVRGSGSDGQNKNVNGPKWTGIVLIVIGIAFLGRNLIPDFPRWIFRWEMILVTIGLIVGIRHQFRGMGWFILVAIGGISMLDVILPVFNKPQFTWATIAIVIGLYLIIRPGNKLETKQTPSVGDSYWTGTKKESLSSSFDASQEHSEKEMLDATSIFSNVTKIIMSKDFQGGEIVVVMGGGEINLSKADVKGRVRLNATNIMGGIELIVPPTWHVQSAVVSIMGGVEDKRDPHFLRVDPDKILFLEGVCLLGGIEIKSY